MDCKYSMVKKPCIIRDPSGDDCRACLKAMSEHDNLCPTCGADKQAYLETMGEECWHGHPGINVYPEYFMTNTKKLEAQLKAVAK